MKAVLLVFVLFLLGAGCAAPQQPINNPTSGGTPPSYNDQTMWRGNQQTTTTTQQPTVQPPTANDQQPTPAPKPTLVSAKKNTAVQQPTTQSSTNSNQPTTPNPSTYYVSIFDNSFSPQVLAVNVGDSVVWTNKGTSNHTSVSTKVWDSSNIFPGTSFKRVFNAPGSYSYYCGVHPSMTGTVIVR